jgi:hypothetical protein
MPPEGPHGGGDYLSLPWSFNLEPLRSGRQYEGERDRMEEKTYLATAREDATDPVAIEVVADRNLWRGRSPVERSTATTMARAPHRERRQRRA